MTPMAVVYERHLEGGHIERSFTITVDGVTQEIPREKPRLKPNAIPTICDNSSPSRLPRAVAQKRVVAPSCEGVVKHLRLECSGAKTVSRAEPPGFMNVTEC